MSTPQLPLAAPEQPVALRQRGLYGAGGALLAMVLVAITIAIGVAMPKPNYALVLGGIVGALALAALVMSPRLDWTVGGLVFFLGCVDGPLKLISKTGTVGSALQNVLIGAILVGLIVRHVMSGKRLVIPPLAGWAIAFAAVVLVEAFNPKTLNALKALAGIRDQLQFVPFFIFGWLLVRSKARLRKAFLLLGVIALANGVVSSYQTRLSPAQAASWGAGYEQKFTGKARKTYKSGEGEAKVRPTGLGDESGGGGGAGIIAVAGTLALLAYTRRKRWAIALLLFGAIAAIATSLGRIELVGGVLAVGAYLLLAGSTGRHARRSVRFLLVALALAIPFGVIFVSSLGEGTFSRYSGLLSGEGTNSTSYKEDELRQIPKEVSSSPFGFGLGTAGPAAGFGGKSSELLEGHNVNAETTYNYIVKEVGLPGILIWAGTLLTMVILALTRIRTLVDPELQTYLAAVFAPVVAMLLMSFEGPVTQSNRLAPYFWFALGVAGYWLAGPGYRAARRRVGALGQRAPVPVAT